MDIVFRGADRGVEHEFARTLPPARAIGGGPIARVEFGANHAWCDALLAPPQAEHAWQRWSVVWQASPGQHELSCRATDALGRRQPLEPPWDLSGFGNNAVQRVPVSVRS